MALACRRSWRRCASEVLDDDLGLLGQVGGVEGHEPGDGPPGLGGLVGGVVGDGLLDPPVGLVGRVVGQHVEDEALLDGLAHGVEVERLERPGLGVPGAEHLQGPGLRGGGEGEEREVRLLAPGADGLRQGLFDRVDGFGDEPGVLGLGGGQFLLLGRTEDQSEVLGCLAGLGGVGLVHDHGVAAGRKLADLVETKGNFWRVVMMIRACSPARASASWFESLSIFTTTPRACSNW